MGIVLFATAGFAQESLPTQRPWASLSENQSVDVGTVDPCIRTNLFRVRNTGAAPVQIRKLIPTCPCVRGFADKTVIGTNEEAVIAFELNAALLSDTFKRDLWVETDDPNTARILLSVTGAVKPLFSGLPPMPVSLVSDEPRAAWTNRYTLTPAEAQLILGPPQILADSMRVEVGVETNRSSARNDYVITVVAATTQPGKTGARILFPVSDGLNTNLPPTVLMVHAVTGAELHVTPSALLLSDSGTDLTRRVRIRTSDQNVSAEKLDWQPRLEGVSVKVEAVRSKTGLSVVVSLSQQAVQDLIKQKDAKLTFSYPHHEPAVLALIPATAENAAR